MKYPDCIVIGDLGGGDLVVIELVVDGTARVDTTPPPPSSTN